MCVVRKVLLFVWKKKNIRHYMRLILHDVRFNEII
jgi:hypothetical protein